MLPYGLYSALWIYFGSVLWNTSMATVRPLRDTVRDTSCELIDDPTAREARYRELVRKHGPVCNATQASEAPIHRITQARTKR